MTAEPIRGCTVLGNNPSCLGNEAFFVQCPICEKRTKGYELPDMAIQRWNQRELLNKKKRRR